MTYTGKQIKPTKHAPLAELMPSDEQVGEEVIGQFCARVYAGNTPKEAADALDQPLQLFEANRYTVKGIDAALEFAADREEQGPTLRNPGLGRVSGNADIRHMLTKAMAAEGFFEAFVKYARLVGQMEGDVLLEEMHTIQKNRVLSEILVRQSISEDTTTHKISRDTETVESLAREVEMLRQKSDEALERDAERKQHNLNLRRRLESADVESD